jgi:hypothetical protein
MPGGIELPTCGMEKVEKCRFLGSQSDDQEVWVMIGFSDPRLVEGINRSLLARGRPAKELLTDLFGGITGNGVEL